MIEVLEQRLARAGLAVNGLPELHSLPGAPVAIYLDFDGEGALAAYDVDGDPATFNAAEQATVTDVWRQVGVAFAMFKVDVTTVKPEVPFVWQVTSPSIAGGYSYVGAFPNTAPQSFNNDSHARTWVWAITHEIAHNFGLAHQSSYDQLGNKVDEYSPGYPLHGPIMGYAPAQDVQKWMLGHPSSSASGLQDDLALIADRIKPYDTPGGDGYRLDDVAGTIAGAMPLPTTGGTRSASGIIERLGDVDTFSFTTAGGAVSISVVPLVPSGLDAKLEVYDATGRLVAAQDGATNDQRIALPVTAGTWYVAVSSHGDYGDVGTYDLTIADLPSGLPGTPPATSPIAAPAGTAVTVGSGTDLVVSWQPVSGATGYLVERSADGITFADVGIAGASAANWTDTGLAGAQRFFYRVRATDASGRSAAASATAVTRPGPVTAATVTSLSTSQVVLNWRDTSGETGYRIERSSDNVVFTTVATVAANVPSCVVTGLAAGAPTSFRITPIGPFGDSVPTVVVGSPRLLAVASTSFTAKTASALGIQWTAVNNATSYRVERSTDGSTYTKVATVSGLAYTDTSVAPLAAYYYRVVATNALTEGVNPVLPVLSATPSAVPLPAGWISADIGSVVGSGAAGWVGGGWTAVAGGTVIGGAADAFHYTYQPLVGDGSITAQVASFDAKATAARVGVMIRESTAASAREVMLALSPSGAASLVYRQANGSNTMSVAGPAGLGPPRWMRLTRSGDLFSAAVSADGTIWTPIGGATVAMSSSVFVGLAANSGSNQSLATATFSDVAIEYAVDVATALATTATLGRVGTGTLVKRGGGTLVLAAASSHSGGTVVEAGELVIRDPRALGSGRLEVRAGGRVTLDLGSGTLDLTALVVEAAARLDIGRGRLTVSGAGIAEAAIWRLLQAGRNEGNWDGAAGITSRAAAAPGRTLGCAVDDTTITVAYAARGDTNLDGFVDVADIANMLGNIDGPGTSFRWSDGDFNYDGRVDQLDVAEFLGTGLFDQGAYLTAVEAAFADNDVGGQPVYGRGSRSTVVLLDQASK